MDSLIGFVGTQKGSREWNITAWQIVRHQSGYGEEGFRVTIRWSGESDNRAAIKNVKTYLAKAGIDWLVSRGTTWMFDSMKFRAWFPTIRPSKTSQDDLLKEIEWMTGTFAVEPTVETKQSQTFMGPRGEARDTFVRFNIYREDFLVSRKVRLFLSHKGANKAMVRPFYDTLRLLGFDPWLDEEDMPGGTDLHRGIMHGMKDSCMAVFFITPQFQDERFLKGELNLAVQERTVKGERFVILALSVKDETGNRGAVPEILRQWVHKSPDSELQALNEIIRAIPLELGPPAWKPGL